jgi:large subunit ribosomal protein L30
MPEKKTVTEKAVTPKVEKPVVKKTTTKAVATASKSKATTAAKAPATKVKSPAALKPEATQVKAPKVVEEPKLVVETAKPVSKPEAKKVLKGKVLKITLLKSGIGYSKRHKATLKALGFRRLHQTIEQVDTPSLRGMLAMVNHLVRIEEQGTK